MRTTSASTNQCVNSSGNNEIIVNGETDLSNSSSPSKLVNDNRKNGGAHIQINDQVDQSGEATLETKQEELSEEELLKMID
jgi:hypothetical protein